MATHASIVFLAGDRAYKLKRAVRYAYLDYSTAVLHRTACEGQFKPNRQVAAACFSMALNRTGLTWAANAAQRRRIVAYIERCSAAGRCQGGAAT